MSRLSLAALLLITTLLTACQSKYDEEMPADFSFVIQSLSAFPLDSYDSAKGTFTKLYLKGDSTIRVPISLKEKKAFYQAFCKADFLSFPDEFKCIGGGAVPGFQTKIIVTYKGTTKTIYMDDICVHHPLELIKVKRFEELTSKLNTWIHSQKAVQRMRPADYMLL